MQRQHVGLLEQRPFAGGGVIPGLRRTPRRARLSPNQHPHPQASPGLSDQRADIAQSENAKRGATQPMRQSVRKLAPPHPFCFNDDITARGDHQRDGQFRRRGRRIAFATRNHHAMLAARRVIDGCGITSNQSDQLQIRQPLDQRAIELDPLTDRDDHFRGPQPIDQLLERRRRLPIARDVMTIQQ